MRQPAAHAFVAVWLALFALAGCDNIGGVFDPDVTGGSAGEGSGIQAMVVGGKAEDGRPRVLSVYPTGGGWPATVPIVVVFNETVNFDSVAPPANTGRDPNLFVREAGTTQVLNATYDFLLGGRVVLIRPDNVLTSTAATPEFEIVITSGVTDGDGLTFSSDAETVLGTFIADEATGGSSLSSIEDGRILVTLPEDNATDVEREVPIYAIFTKPVDPISVTTSSFVVRTGGVPISGARTFPPELMIGPAAENRVLRFDATTALAGSASIEIVVDNTITFGGGTGVLDFGNRTPFADFTTIPFLAVQSVTVGNATMGFPDKVNIGNLTNLQIDVAVDASAQAGDRVVVRIYGLDPSTETPTDDVDFVERDVTLSQAGAHTATVDFSSALGTLTSPLFSDGALTLAAQHQRGETQAGFILADSANDPRLDVTPPDLVAAGPPGNGLNLFSDLEQVAFSGQASESLSSAMLTVGSEMADLWAADGNRFVMKPVDLGLSTTSQAYQLTITDSAGNLSTSAFTGNIVPRGVVAGAFSGTLTVEAYDASTLAPIAGATIVVQADPALPANTTMTSGTDGRAVFTGVSNPSTVTIEATGYELKTLMNTGARHVSLGLQPLSNPVASFSGTAAFIGPSGSTLLVGHNLIADELGEVIETTPTLPNVFPATSIRPNRLQVVNVFGGVFPPSTNPQFQFSACQICGPDAVTPAAPGPALSAGESDSLALTLLSTSAVAVPLTTYSLDFALAGGLGALAGTPTVHIRGGLEGLPGMSLYGVGFATNTAAAMYDINPSMWTVLSLLLSDFSPSFYVSVEGRDSAGNVSRHRAAIDPSLATTSTALGANPPGIPTITDPPPGAPFTGSPLVTYEDRFDGAAAGGLNIWGLLRLTATDGTGNRWVVLQQDTDVVLSGDTLQFPDLSTSGATGLAAGTWSVLPETFSTFTTTFGANQFVFEEFPREQVSYARGTAVNFTVN